MWQKTSVKRRFSLTSSYVTPNEIETKDPNTVKFHSWWGKVIARSLQSFKRMGKQHILRG